MGVLEVLQQLRVPVDCVAGTSMGALVAGAWASGLSPERMRAELAQVDWKDLFQDDPEYTDMAYRNKRLSQNYLPGSELGVSANGTQAPPGVLGGQKIKLLFNRLVGADRGEQEIENLPLPLSIIATDIGDGARVVLREGSLSQAMRASMSVPGLMAPVRYAGHKLVDGGLVDNLPVQEVRERCGAEVVIAVNVGSPLLPPDQVGSLLSVSAQMVNILTEQNVTRSRALLHDADVYIRPALGDITSGNFDRNADAAERGREAALAVRERLQSLAVSRAAYNAWWGQIARADLPAPQVDAIDIAAMPRLDTRLVARDISQPVGAALDTPALQRDLLRVYGEGYFQTVDYSLVREHERNVLRVTPLEKPWGPDYLRFAVNLETSFDQGANYSLRAAYQRTALNRLGGEMTASVQMGSKNGLALGFYQPLNAVQRWFVEPQVEYENHSAPVYQNNHRMAEYKVSNARISLAAGANLERMGQLRLGLESFHGSAHQETGTQAVVEQSQQVNGWFASADLDRLNRLYMPTAGWALQSRYFSSAQRAYSKIEINLNGALPLGRYVWSGKLSYSGAGQGVLPLFDAASLGGFLNMSAYARGQLLGDKVSYGRLGVSRVLGQLPLGVRGDMRVGLALERARMGTRFTEQQGFGLLDSATIYLGGETPLGPVYVGYGFSSNRQSNAYLFLGVP